MKVKQKSIRSFEFVLEGSDEGPALLEYTQQNLEILKNYLLVIEGDAGAETLEALKNLGLRVLGNSNGLVAKGRENRPLATVAKPTEKESASGGTQTYTAPIRSGTELECDDDVIIFGRINSGARVVAKKNAIIFSLIDGTVEASGDYLIARRVGKGHLYFHGESVDPGKIKHGPHKITMGASGLVYEEL